MCNFCRGIFVENSILFEERFEDNYLKGWKTAGRLSHSVDKGVLSVKDGYVFTESDSWGDFEFSFSGRMPAEEKEVQIWAGFRHFRRDFRYVLALRGGNNNHMYLARYGAEGHDRFLDIAPLDFKPSLGTWYRFRVVAAGNTIAVFLNDEESPRLLRTDDTASFHSGGVTLGGSYLKAEFKDVTVANIDKNALEGVSRYKLPPVVADKKMLRTEQLNAYKPLHITDIGTNREEISLNGDWLFMPDKGKSKDSHVDISADDDWHIMDVPNFWVPTRAWLEGERFEGGLFNKGQNDDFHREEQLRCENYTFDYEVTGSAWYRHTLILDKEVLEKQLVLHFEGVSLISEVSINGKKLHENRGMFGPFDVDITEHLREGENILVIHVDRLAGRKNVGTGDLAVDAIEDNYSAAWDIIDSGGDSGKSLKVLDKMELPRGFYGGNPGGIWKPVSLIISDKIRVEECFFIPDLTSASVEVWYSNNNNCPSQIELHYELTERGSGNFLCRGLVEKQTIGGGETRKTHFETGSIKPKLWAPGEPNLYLLHLFIVKDGVEIDRLTETVGFRTTGIDGNRITINGRHSWIRGANHMPGHIKPNDAALAGKFMELALSHNVMATRTHCAPFSKTWMKAADEAGVMVSYEGTWPWFMLRGKDAPPESAVQIWLDDMGRLFKANRNHPSLFMWTMNNEMKFMIFGTGKTLRVKGDVLNRAMKMVREMDPSRPVIADSSYFRKIRYLVPRLHLLLNRIDDGDIDDPHVYNSWYENSFFHLAHGEFSKMHALKNRPLITQEASTGYPRSQDGLPTRSYLFDHQTPQTWVGRDAYEQCDPKNFLKRHAMLTKGTFETLRRVDHQKISGTMPFAFETWFYHHHDAEKVTPMETAKALKTVYQGILASADLQVLHYFAGSRLKTEITLLNDDLEVGLLNNASVSCEVVYEDEALASESLAFDAVEYYGERSRWLDMALPEEIPSDKIDARLRLCVIKGDEVLSVNSYDIVIATKRWALEGNVECKSYAYIKGDEEVRALLAFAKIRARAIGISDLDKSVDKLILGKKLKSGRAFGNRLKEFSRTGGEVLLLHPGKKALKLFPGLITRFTGEFHEIVTMTVKESPVFDRLEPLELSWFPYKPYKKRKAGFIDAYVPSYSGFDKKLHSVLYKPKVPHVARGRYSIDRKNPDIEVLAETLQPHGYINSDKDYRNLGGTPLFDVRTGLGKVRVSEIRYDVVHMDPIAARFIKNILM